MLKFTFFVKNFISLRRYLYFSLISSRQSPENGADIFFFSAVNICLEFPM